VTLVYFAPVPWDSYLQRPHHLIRHFLRRGGDRAVWVDPYPTRLPTMSDVQRRWTATRLVTERPPGLTILSLRAVPFEPLAAGRWLNRVLLWKRFARRLQRLQRGAPLVIGVGRPSGFALAALRTLRPDWTFYDAMDDFPEFYQGIARRTIAACEAEIANTVDALLTPSSAIWDKFAGLGSKRLMLHNASEMSLLPPPAAHNGHRVLGYVGCIGAWFDWPLVARLAESSPDATVQIVGPCFARPRPPLPRNVKLFPACAHHQAMAHLERFSVGLIPFKRTRLTEGVDPIKYYEYRAMGLPVLTTTFGEMARRGLDDCTYFLDKGGSLRQVASSALDRSSDPAAVACFRKEHTWERRFEAAKLFEQMTRV
jgi:hypothetical protein